MTRDDDRISAFLDGELTELERKRFEAELHKDADLRQEVERFKQIRALTRRHGPVRAPRGFADAVMDAVDEAPETAQRAAWWRRPFGVPVEGLAVAAAALLVLTLALPSAPPDEEVPHAAVEVMEVQVASSQGGDANVYRAPRGWAISATEDEVRAAIGNIGRIETGVVPKGDLRPKGAGLRVELDAARLGELRAALESLGAIEPLGKERLAVGDTTMQLVLRP